MNLLLTKQEFVKQVTECDNNTCVHCKNIHFKYRDDIKLEVHHIMDRSLFEDGGYYLDNGVTLCSHCHLTKAENTLYSPKRFRELANIKNIFINMKI